MSLTKTQAESIVKVMLGSKSKSFTKAFENVMGRKIEEADVDPRLESGEVANIISKAIISTLESSLLGASKFLIVMGSPTNEDAVQHNGRATMMAIQRVLQANGLMIEDQTMLQATVLQAVGDFLVSTLRGTIKATEIGLASSKKTEAITSNTSDGFWEDLKKMLNNNGVDVSDAGLNNPKESGCNNDCLNCTEYSDHAEELYNRIIDAESKEDALETIKSFSTFLVDATTERLKNIENKG
jgi:hypothetical protein